MIRSDRRGILLIATEYDGEPLRFFFCLWMGLCAGTAWGQGSGDAAAALPDAPQANVAMLTPLPDTHELWGAESAGAWSQSGQSAAATSISGAGSTVDPKQQQPKRILGFMPNYRAVSAGEIPPPPSAKQAFKLATVNSFDYSAIVFGALTSLLAEGTNTHPDLGKGVPGFWAYNWRGFVDKTDGNYMVVFAMPTLLHEDVRYYALGHGGFKRRLLYAASSVLIARNYQGQKTFSGAEVFGRAIAQGVSTFYYPDQDDTMGALFARYGYSIGRDAITASFREFWPDIATHVLHRHP